MRHLAAAFLAALLLATPATARSSDVDSFASFLSEYTAQHAGIVELLIERNRAEAPEKPHLTLKLEAALVATIEHLSALPTRPCFASFAELTLAEFEAIADHLAALATNPALAQVQLSHAGSIVTAINGEVRGTLIDCVGDTE